MTFGSYAKSLIGAKAATIGMQAATMALNAAISMGISLAISGAIKLIDYLIHRSERLIEAGQEAAKEIESIKNDFASLTKTVDDTAEQFAKLSQGVDKFNCVFIIPLRPQKCQH